MNKERHYTVAIFIIHNNTLLLHKHKEYDIWLPVGGHIDQGETPPEAALREAKEEAGLDITLYNASGVVDFKDAQQLIQPVHLLSIKRKESIEFIDFVYYAQTQDSTLAPQLEESQILRWFTEAEITKLPMPENVRILGMESLTRLSQ